MTAIIALSILLLHSATQAEGLAGRSGQQRDVPPDDVSEVSMKAVGGGKDGSAAPKAPQVPFPLMWNPLASTPKAPPLKATPSAAFAGDNWRNQEGLIFPMRGHAPAEQGGTPVVLFERSKVPNQMKPAQTQELYGVDLQDPIGKMCCPNDRSQTYHNVSFPWYVPFLDVESKGQPKTDIGVLVIPGGGFNFMSWEKEGTDIAVWLNSLGISAFVLKYRVPNHGLMWSDSIQDAQRSMSLIRSRAKEYGINSKRIGVIGFSAGGKLALDLSSSIYRTYPVSDAADNEHWNPNFQMIIYGWGDVWNMIGPPPPPSFFVSTKDDQCVPADWVKATATAMERAGGIVDLHLFPNGRHGYGRCTMYTEDGDWHDVCQWPQLAQHFLLNHVLNDGGSSSAPAGDERPVTSFPAAPPVAEPPREMSFVPRSAPVPPPRPHREVLLPQPSARHPPPRPVRRPPPRPSPLEGLFPLDTMGLPPGEIVQRPPAPPRRPSPLDGQFPPARPRPPRRSRPLPVSSVPLQTDTEPAIPVKAPPPGTAPSPPEVGLSGDVAGRPAAPRQRVPRPPQRYMPRRRIRPVAYPVAPAAAAYVPYAIPMRRLRRRRIQGPPVR